MVLQLPAALCAARAAQRVDHEGGLQGASAKSVVYRMASQMTSAGLPNAATEGLSSVMVRTYPCNMLGLQLSLICCDAFLGTYCCLILSCVS